MQANKKRATQSPAEVRPAVDTKTPPRPVGMQTMGPTLYEQIRRVLVEMKLVSEN